MEHTSESANPVAMLVKKSLRHPNRADLVADLASLIRDASIPVSDLQYTIGALRAALEDVGAISGPDTQLRCIFCGKSRDVVQTLLVSGEGTICDECVLAGVEAMSLQHREFSLRIAFGVFRCLARLRKLPWTSRSNK